MTNLKHLCNGKDGDDRMLNRLSADEWDVLIYVASYISGYKTRPTQVDLVQARLPECAMNRLLRKGMLVDVNGGLEPVLQATDAVRNAA